MWPVAFGKSTHAPWSGKPRSPRLWSLQGKIKDFLEVIQQSTASRSNPTSFPSACPCFQGQNNGVHCISPLGLETDGSFLSPCSSLSNAVHLAVSGGC